MSTGGINGSTSPVVGASTRTVSNAAPAADASTSGTTAPNPSSTGYDSGSATGGGWDATWAKRFSDAGVPRTTIDQLNQSGGMGYSDAELGQLLDQQKQQVDDAVGSFKQAYPDLYGRLVSYIAKHPEGLTLGASQDPLNPGTSDIAEIAAMVMQSPEASRAQIVKTLDGMTDDTGGMGQVKMMLPQIAVPGWGAVRVASGAVSKALGGDGRAMSGERVETDPKAYLKPSNYNPMLMMTGGSTVAMDALWGLSGTVVLANTVVGYKMLRQAQQLKAAGGSGTAAQIGARLDTKLAASGWERAKQWQTGTLMNRQLSGMTRAAELDKAVSSMTRSAGTSKADVLHGSILKDLQTRIADGRVQLTGEGSIKLNMMGQIGNSRGIIMNRGNTVSAGTIHGVPTIMADLNTRGAASVPHIASAGVDFIDPALRSQAIEHYGLQTEKFLPKIGLTKLSELTPASAERVRVLQGDALREAILGGMTSSLEKSTFLTRPTGILGSLREIHGTPMAKAFQAADRVSAKPLGEIGELGAKRGLGALLWSNRSPLGKVGVVAGGILAYLGATKYILPKIMGGGAAPAAGDAGSSDAAAGAADAQSGAVAAFAAKTPDEQYALLSQQYQTITAAAAAAGSDPTATAAVNSAITEFQTYANAADPTVQDRVAKLLGDSSSSTG